MANREQELPGEGQPILLPSKQEVLSMKTIDSARKMSRKASRKSMKQSNASMMKTTGTDTATFVVPQKSDKLLKRPNTTKGKDMEMYCTQQIQIPPNLPGILKAFTKAAIRTQPPDLLTWSVSYFECMANGDVPPVKDRLEFVSETATEGLTIGLLQVLHKQLQIKDYVTFSEVKEKWRGICMKEKHLHKIWKKANWDKAKDTEWKKVITLLCTLVGRNMNETMDAVCQVLTTQPIGGEPYLEWDEFWDIYVVLAKIDGSIKRSTVEAAKDYLRPIALANHGLIGPRDFKHQNCPSLF